MYKIVEVEDNVRVRPDLFVMELKDAIKEVVRENYEGKIFKDLGYVVKVLDSKPKNVGIVVAGDPYVYYRTKFNLLVFMPEQEEVYRGVVRDVVEFGAFVSIGPFEALLHVSQLGREKFLYDREKRMFHNVDKSKTLKKGDIVIAKLSTVGMRGAPSNVKISLTMREQGLGAIHWEDTSVKKERKGKGGGKK